MNETLHLLIAVPGAPPRHVGVGKGDHRVGRASDNEIPVAHPSLSRNHARLRIAGGVMLLSDLGSSNGTFLRDKRVREMELRFGDTFRCGDVTFTLSQEAPELPALSAPTASASAREPRKPGASTMLRALLIDDNQSDGGHSSILLRAQSGEDRAQQKLQVLIEVGQVLSSPGHQDAMLSRVLDLLFQVFDVDRASLLLLDEAGRAQPRLTRMRSGEDGKEPIHSQRIVEEAIQKAHGILANDASQDPRFAAAVSVQMRGIRSSMCVPLRVRDVNIGALYVDHLTVPNRYGAEDLDFLGSFANQAATALDNTRLYAELEQEAVRRSALSRFFPPSVLGPVLHSPDFGLVPQDLEVSVLFSDISGFTAMSSTMPPREIVSMLNRYFPVMAEIVFRHEGTLEKYIGDALMAIWGAPAAHEDDADRALRAAIEMRRAVTRLNRELPQPLDIHVGLNAGPVAFGNIGSSEYQQFAAIGDATNVASRVCSLAATGDILISESIHRRLSDRYDLEPLPLAYVKGKELPLQTYKVRNL
ncbi:MAG: adenylate/guanylate cyclase domain-containing protein [Vicinamibacteria bacterium]